MPERALYRKYRRLIEEVADERRSAELSFGTLRALLQEFRDNAATLDPPQPVTSVTSSPTNSSMRHFARRSSTAATSCLRPSKLLTT
jgi:hypothetical protein